MRAPVIQISAEVAHAHAKHNGSLRKRASQAQAPTCDSCYCKTWARPSEAGALRRRHDLKSIKLGTMLASEPPLRATAWSASAVHPNQHHDDRRLSPWLR